MQEAGNHDRLPHSHCNVNQHSRYVIRSLYSLSNRKKSEEYRQSVE